MDILQILSITLSLVVLVSVLEFIRRGVFKEKYALLWLFASIVLLIISFWRGLLDFTAGIFGFYYPPSFLFLLGLGFLLLITLHFSIVVSNLSEKNKKLAQELGILKEKLEKVLDTEKADNAQVKNQ
ncbi:MAG: DUF2304 domain-containing protein [Thermodesulfovibrionia bacterium]|nr:DUF2304 domain-containing protein [Thermodesulfovibrionia bacterium]